MFTLRWTCQKSQHEDGVDLRVTGQDGYIQGLRKGNGEGICIRDSEFHFGFGGAEDILSSEFMDPDWQQQNLLRVSSAVASPFLLPT